MEPSGWILLGLTVVTVGVLVGCGRAPERLAAGAFLALVAVNTAFDHLVIGGFRWVVALSSLGLFLVLAVLSLKSARWWLLAAAGVQLVALMTHLAALVQPDLQVWAAVSIRYLVWLELMVLGLLGAWEARCAPYARP